jgi:uncharacterized coiled-coil DUF342 family protein
MEYIHLIGTDDVKSAGYTMRAAAQDMNRAADNINQSVFQMRQNLNDFLIEFGELVKRMESLKEDQCKKE